MHADEPLQIKLGTICRRRSPSQSALAVRLGSDHPPLQTNISSEWADAFCRGLERLSSCFLHNEAVRSRH